MMNVNNRGQSEKEIKEEKPHVKEEEKTDNERINEVIDQLISRHQELSNSITQKNENSINIPPLRLTYKK